MSELWVNTFKNENGNGAPDFPNGITATGVITATVSNSTLGALTVSGDATIGGNLGVGDSSPSYSVDATGKGAFRSGFYDEDNVTPVTDGEMSRMAGLIAKFFQQGACEVCHFEGCNKLKPEG